MNEIVSFTKEIEFNTMIDKITSISIEHTLNSDGSSIKGDLIIGGTYKETLASQIDNPFSYKIPIEIAIDSKYDLSNMTIDIDDFTYDVIEPNKLKINVDLILDKLELKKEEEKFDDEIIDINDLFLEKEEDKKLEIPLNEEKEEIKEEQKQEVNDSLFSNLDSNSETYKTYSIYIVRDDFHLDELIEKYKVTREKLSEYNDLDNINIGTKLIIPNE